jgi:hypothetical protein
MMEDGVVEADIGLINIEVALTETEICISKVGSEVLLRVTKH